MKSFQQNLLVVLALALCGLCAYQWYVQTQQRIAITNLNHEVYGKSLAIRDYTNSIETLNHQISQFDAQISDLRSTAKSNQALVAVQAREIDQLKATTLALTNEISEYRNGVSTLESKLKEA